MGGEGLRGLLVFRRPFSVRRGPESGFPLCVIATTRGFNVEASPNSEGLGFRDEAGFPVWGFRNFGDQLPRMSSSSEFRNLRLRVLRSRSLGFLELERSHAPAFRHVYGFGAW